MKNPNILAALTSALALSPAHGLAMVQMMADEINGKNAVLNVSKEWDTIISRNNASLAAISGVKIISEYGYLSSPDDAEPGTIAVIPFLYPITKYDWYWAGMDTKAALLQRCLNNQNIIAIIQLMNTPGGEARASANYEKVLATANKPVYTVVDGLCASAGYRIGAAAKNGFYTTNPTDQVGSIGTMMTWLDMRPYFKELGIVIEDLYASAATKKNDEFREALKGNFEPLIKYLDVFNNDFVDRVKQYRGEKITDPEAVFHGQLYFSEQAAATGLTDGMKDFQIILEEVEMVATTTTEDPESSIKKIIF